MLKIQYLISSLLCFAIALMVATTASGEGGTYGVLMVVKGDVQILNGKTGKTEPAKVGSKIFPDDTIIAGKDSRAKIVMVDKNVLNVSPESKIKIDKYEYKPEAEKKNVLLNVMYGKVRATVNQKYDGEKNQFQVKTPSAVAGVRGTDFLTSYNRVSKDSQVVTFSGAVAVGVAGPNGAIVNAVTVRPGQSTTVAQGGMPSQPSVIPKSELAQAQKESSADTATGAPAKEDRAPAGDKNESSKEEKKEDKKEDKKDNKKGDKENQGGSDTKGDKGRKDDKGEKSDNQSGGKSEDRGGDKKGNPQGEDQGQDNSQRKGPKKDGETTSKGGAIQASGDGKQNEGGDSREMGNPERGSSPSGKHTSDAGPAPAGDFAGGPESNGPRREKSDDSRGPASLPGGGLQPGGMAGNAPPGMTPGMPMLDMNDLPSGPGNIPLPPTASGPSYGGPGGVPLPLLPPIPDSALPPSYTPPADICSFCSGVTGGKTNVRVNVTIK